MGRWWWRMAVAWLMACTERGPVIADGAAPDAPRADGGGGQGPDAGPDSGVSDAAAPERDGAPPSSDAALTPDAALPDPALVTTPSGALHGALSGETRVFRGVPYAEPPLAALRFAQPLPKAAWTGTREATLPPRPCPQYGDPVSDAVAPLPASSEDCLTLDVYAPQAQGEARPVMVFFHGGGFTTGGAASYDGAALSRAGDLIVVVAQYRLGPLGFLAHPALDAALGAPSGNMGLRDQQLALRWVQRSIAAFGGDPGRVTVFGESAGAISTCLHMVMPESAGLAQRFIIQSGACVAGEVRPWTRARSEALATQLMADLCPGAAEPLACLRALPAAELVRWLPADPLREALVSLIQPTTSVGQDFWPYVDGALLPDMPRALIERGAFAKAPILVGSNADEWITQEHFGFPRAASRLDYDFWSSLMAQSADMKPLVAHYAPASDAEAPAAFRRLWSDAWFRCPSRVLARSAAAQGAPVYLYDFAVAPGGHAEELDYVFGIAEGFVSKLFPGVAPLPPSASVVSAVQALWTSFARDGVPRAAGAPDWPVYTRRDDAHLRIAAPLAVGSALSAADCDAWDAQWSKAP